MTIASLLGGGIIFGGQPIILAQEKNLIPASIAQGRAGETVTLNVSPYGIVISFEDLKESIQKYWATDDTYLRVGTNAPLGPEANLLFLKTEGKWSDSSNGTAVTVQTKNRSGESKTYSFLVEFQKDKPKYSILRIYPDSGSTPIATSKVDKTVLPPAIQTVPKVTDSNNLLKGALPQSVPNAPSIAISPNSLNSALPGIGSQIIKSAVNTEAPSVPPQQSASESQPVAPQQVLPDNNVSLPQPFPQPINQQAIVEKVPATATNTSATQPSTLRKPPSALSFAHSQANALVRGVLVATRNKELNPRGVLATKVQYVIRRLRRGEDLVSSAKKESVELRVINRLLELGNYKAPS
jgi:hypothetical protein